MFKRKSKILADVPQPPQTTVQDLVRRSVPMNELSEEDSKKMMDEVIAEVMEWTTLSAPDYLLPRLLTDSKYRTEDQIKNDSAHIFYRYFYPHWWSSRFSKYKTHAELQQLFFELGFVQTYFSNPVPTHADADRLIAQFIDYEFGGRLTSYRLFVACNSRGEKAYYIRRVGFANSLLSFYP